MSMLPRDILIVNKPRGMTSHDVVDRIRKKTGIKKVGHAGTLDPLAEGILIVLVGKEATKRQKEFLKMEKEYVATIRLGATSATDDAEGDIETTAYGIRPTAEKIRKHIADFIGEIEQVPPAYSAVKILGKRAYELARRGKMPYLKPRKITIKEIELVSYRWPRAKIHVVCSSGTYVRSIARDIGEALGCGAYLTALTRTRSGAFTLKDAVSLSAIVRGPIAKRPHSRYPIL